MTEKQHGATLLPGAQMTFVAKVGQNILQRATRR
jgi:hypothetical protein